MRSLILLTALIFSLIPTERVTAKNPDPPSPLKKGEPDLERIIKKEPELEMIIKVPLTKGDLGGSRSLSITSQFDITSIPSPQQLTEAGRTQYQNGKFAEAAQLWQQAANAFETAGDPLNQAIVFSNLALAYQQLGQTQQSQQAIEKSFQRLGCPASDIGCAVSGKDQTQILAQVLTTLGSLQLSQGKAEQAFHTWQKASDRYQQVNDATGVVRSQINQAQALRTGGLYRRAETGLQKIQQTLESQSDPALKASGLINYGDSLRLMGRLKQSEEVLQQGLKLAQQQLNQQPNQQQFAADISTAYLNLGNTARAMIKPNQSDREQYIKTALNYYQQSATIAPNSTLKLQAQLNQLTLQVDYQTGSDSQALAKKILPEFSAIPSNRTKVYAQINYAKNLIKLADSEPNPGYEKSCQSTIAWTPIALITSNTPALDSSQIEQLLTDSIQQSQNLQDWQAESFALGSLAYFYEVQGKCSVAIDLTKKALAIAHGHNASDIAYRWEWQMGRLYRNLAMAEVGKNASQNLASNSNYENAIQFYKAAFNTLRSLRQDLSVGNAETQLDFQEQTEEPIYRELVDVLLRPPTPSQDNLIQARKVIESLQIAELENFLKEPCVISNSESIDQVADETNSTTAALFPIILKDRVEVILKLPRQKELVHYRYPIAQSKVRETLQTFREKLQTDYAFETVKDEANSVYQWLIEPARTRLEASKINTLVFVPDSQFQNIPMATLYDGKQFLVENFATPIALNLALQNPKPLPKVLRVLAASLTDPPATFSNFGQLANVGKELDAIAKAGLTLVPIRDEQFTNQRFNQMINESSFSIVHLATHGQFSSDPQKTFLLTASGSIKVDDLGTLFRTRGLNRSDEIELLVLSACETASGDNRAPLGIAGTTLRAGARSTIASLWSVDDESSVELMNQFYQQLGKGNVSRSEALRQAQVTLMKSGKYSYPRYWAPFILLGNWL
jgi:CHAT domain-containing protein